MELQTWIQSTPTYLDELKEKNMILRKRGDLCLIKYKYGRDDFSEEWMRYCRGCVIDTKTHQLLCIPPPKARLNIPETLNGSYSVENLLDGTMINMFYYKNEWIMCTRSDIGCMNKWKSNLSFKDMFYECCPHFDTSLLQKENTYSFVMCHISNRNVSMIHENYLCLVDVFDRTTFQRVNLSEVELPCVHKIETYNYDAEIPLQYHIDSLNEMNLDYNWKGFTVKCGTKRYNYINPKYSQVKEQSINTNNKLYEYLELFKGKRLQKHLRVYPEDKYLFDQYQKKIHTLKQEMHKEYIHVFILKKKEKNRAVAKELYKLHGIYLKEKQKITYKIVSDFVDQLTNGRIMHLIRYFIGFS